MTLQTIYVEYWHNFEQNHIDFIMQDLQIDNQLRRAKWTCALFREHDDDVKNELPFFRFSMDQLFTNKTIDIFPSIQISIQVGKKKKRKKKKKKKKK